MGIADITDEQLVQRLREDPAQGFSDIYRRYSGPIFRLISRFTQERSTAEEILHDVFLELWKNEFKAQSSDGLKNWLFTLAKNKSLNHFRQTRKSEAYVDRASGEPSVLDRLEHQQLSAKFIEVQEKMSTEFKDVWRLRREGLDHQQIAQQLGIPLGTVKSRFHRMVEFLKESLKNEISG